MSHFDRFVGIDISKNRLDIYCHPDGLAFCVANTSDGIGRLAKAGGGGVAFGCEATGGYEDLLLVTLSQAGTPLKGVKIGRRSGVKFERRLTLIAQLRLPPDPMPA